MVIPKALPFYLYLPSLKIRESNRFNLSKMNKIINVSEWLEENKVALSTPPVCNELMHFGQLIIMFVGGGNIREDFHINEGEELFYQLKGEMLLVIEEAGRDVSYEYNITRWYNSEIEGFQNCTNGCHRNFNPCKDTKKYQ